VHHSLIITQVRVAFEVRTKNKILGDWKKVNCCCCDININMNIAHINRRKNLNIFFSSKFQGEFEASVEVESKVEIHASQQDAAHLNMSVTLDSVTRIDAYGNMGDCMWTAQKILMRLCICK
jgi:hypothetical protein